MHPNGDITCAMNPVRSSINSPRSAFAGDGQGLRGGHLPPGGRQHAGQRLLPRLRVGATVARPTALLRRDSRELRSVSLHFFSVVVVDQMNF